MSLEITSFLKPLKEWRAAYRTYKLVFIAKSVSPDGRIIVSAKITLQFPMQVSENVFEKSGDIVWGVLYFNDSEVPLEGLLDCLFSNEGYISKDYGTFWLPKTVDSKVDYSTPLYLHPQGEVEGKRLAILRVTGDYNQTYLPQNESNWTLMAGDIPYNSIAELKTEFDLNNADEYKCSLDIFAYSPILISSKSNLQGNNAKIGITIPNILDRNKTKISYIVMDGQKAINRSHKDGYDLSWNSLGESSEGWFELEVNPGSDIHCMASFNEVPHNRHWLSDHSNSNNPRSVVISSVDKNRGLINEYLQLNPIEDQNGNIRFKESSSDDFEDAVGWTFWTMGFSPVNFGYNKKTKEFIDLVVSTPNGDFLVIECTLGILKGDSKLPKLHNRFVTLREQFDRANLSHIRMLPVMITALKRDHVSYDISQANEAGILVLTREDLQKITIQSTKSINANHLFDEWFDEVQSRFKPGLEGLFK